MKFLLNYRFLVILFLPLLCFVLVYFTLRKPDIEFYNSKDYKLQAFNDSVVQGKSQCVVRKQNNSFLVNFELKQGYEFPFAGVQIERVDGALFDISDYTFHLSLFAYNDMRLSVRHNQCILNYSDTLNTLTYALYLKTFTVKKGKNYYSINTEEINEIPDWWYTLNPLKINDIKTPLLTNTKYIWLYTENTIPLNVPFSFEIQECKLVYNYKPLIIIYLYFSVFYYFVLLIIWKYKKQTIKNLFLPIEHIQIHDTKNSKYSEIVTCIAKNYHNSHFKLSDVSKTVGCSDSEVSEILKLHLQMNFRHYLNTIRMEEATHLLQNTQLQISEIAYAVGYNNVQHFNRVFKEFMNCSPKAYRE